MTWVTIWFPVIICRGRKERWVNYQDNLTNHFPFRLISAPQLPRASYSYNFRALVISLSIYERGVCHKIFKMPKKKWGRARTLIFVYKLFPWVQFCSILSKSNILWRLLLNNSPLFFYLNCLNRFVLGHFQRSTLQKSPGIFRHKNKRCWQFWHVKCKCKLALGFSPQRARFKSHV